MKFSSSFLILSSLLGVLATTPAQVISDITELTSKVSSMDKSVKAMTSKDLAGAWNVHTAAGQVLDSLKVATENVKAATSNPISDADTQKAFDASGSLRDVIVITLNDLIDKEETIDAIPIPGSKMVVRQDLEKMRTGANAFQDAMIAAAKGDMKPKALALAQDVNDAFDRAMNAYTNVN